jgi:hypothetical protein
MSHRSSNEVRGYVIALWFLVGIAFAAMVGVLTRGMP